MIFSDNIITNVLLIQIVKRFENRSIFDEVKAYEVKAYTVCQFMRHPVRGQSMSCFLFQSTVLEFDLAFDHRE